jgi:hypothetical protein
MIASDNECDSWLTWLLLLLQTTPSTDMLTFYEWPAATLGLISALKRKVPNKSNLLNLYPFHFQILYYFFN